MALCLKRLKFDAGVVFRVLCRGSFCQKEITEWVVAYGSVQNKSASLLAVENYSEYSHFSIPSAHAGATTKPLGNGAVT